MLHKLYIRFIQPRQQNEDLRNREFILNVLLAGTLSLMAAAMIILLYSYAILHNTYVLARLLGIAGAFAVTWWIYFLSRSGWRRAAAWMLIILYLLLAASVAWRWGVTLPSAVLLFAMVIMITGTVLGSPYSLYVAAIAIVTILVIEAGQLHGTIKPDLSWMSAPFNIGTVSGYCMIFGIIALISWLFNKRTENSLQRAQRAEHGLRRQKLLLESKVEERTRELQAAQLEKIQQLYRFAELGQLSTALLHDLANHLTTLTLDIEGLETERHSSVVRRAKRSIRYIDEMVLRVRDQLHGRVHIRVLNVAAETQEVMTILTHKATEEGVSLNYELLASKQDLRCRGESIRFRQMIANMVANGIDAYDGTHDNRRREVRVSIELSNNTIIITITDWGKGIDPEGRTKLFEPFYSTKQTGMGMGLFIVKRIIEENFKGTISLDDSLGHTSFVITLKKAP
jgi:signal transduction histidine kinase